MAHIILRLQDVEVFPDVDEVHINVADLPSSYAHSSASLRFLRRLRNGLEALGFYKKYDPVNGGDTVDFLNTILEELDDVLLEIEA
jgi:hypothetical protein